MKTIKIIYFFALLLIFGACDYVKPPVPGSGNGGNQPDTTTQVVKQRIIFLEDYTGHTCGHCPKAADAAAQVHDLYGDKVVILGVHAGGFAAPEMPNYPTDFRTNEGNELNTFFGISSVGNPNGMMNRTGFVADEHVVPYTTWSAKAAIELAKPMQAWITIENSYNASTKLSTIDVKTEFTASLSGEYKLAVYIAEDSIINDQKDYRFSPSHIDNFVHRHVLRGSYTNSAWGETLATDPAVSATTIDKNYSKTMESAWDDRHLYIIAIVYNASTYEVIQAAEKKMIP